MDAEGDAETLKRLQLTRTIEARIDPDLAETLVRSPRQTIQRVLDFYLDRSHAKGISVQVDPARLRPSDVMVLEGDPSKIHKALGWQTEIPFERTLTDLLEYWRGRVASAPH